MDGVIVDNHRYHYLSWQSFSKNHGVPIDEAFYMQNMNGRTFESTLDILFGRSFSEAEVNAFLNEKEGLYRELYRPHLTPVPGLLSLLDEARSAGVPMVVGTSAPTENVAFTLDGLGIRHYFTTVVDATMVTKGKPDPQVYQKCAEAIGRDNRHCVVFEDAVSGITAGKAAGSKVVALSTTMKPEDIDNELIYPDFTNITLETLADIVSE